MTGTHEATTLRNETTRYLCAGVHLDPALAESAIGEYLSDPLRAVPPSTGFDAPLVLREAVAAHTRQRLRDGLLVGLAVTFLVLVGITFVLGAGTAALPWLIVAFGLLLLTVTTADRFALHSLLLRSFQRGNFTSRPTLAEWPGERWLRTLGHQHYHAGFERMDRSGNLVVYRGEKPFVGAGSPREPISFAIPLEPADDSGDDIGAFTLTELYDHISHELLALRASHSLAPSERLSGLAESEQVIVPAEELLVNFGNPMSVHALPELREPPPSSVESEQLSLLAEDPLEWMRYYRCYRIESWDRDVTLSVFLHLGAGERMLYLEWTPCLLYPLREQYHRIDSLSIAPLAPLRGGFGDLLLLPLTLPVRLLRLFRQPGPLVRAGGVSPQRYGANRSLREMAMGTGTRNYFQDADVDRYVKVLQRRMIRAVGEFLDDRKISSTEFMTQAMAVTVNQSFVNSNYVQGNVRGSIFRVNGAT